MRTLVAVCLAASAALPARSAEPLLPLPPAPVRLVVPDVPAFDAALSGGFRDALLGRAAEDDPLAAAWRKTPVGTKLEAQWQVLSRDLPWTWSELLKLKPRALGLSLLAAGELEAVLVLDTPIAVLPVAPPAGTARAHQGTPYALVARGAGDGRLDDRRLGLAWARRGSYLFLATSERALLLALDESLAGRGTSAFLPGLASLELDTDALARDRYFRREFLFGAEAQGRVVAALRAEGGRIVEVREGGGRAGDPAFGFETGDAAAAGWETEGARFFAALRSGLLEAVPSPPALPVPPLLPLPATQATSEDRYLVDLLKPARGPETPGEEGDLASWRALLSKRPAEGWGYEVGRHGERALVFTWPGSGLTDLETACRATLQRRGGAVQASAAGPVRELRLGPDLPVLALRRTGDFVWLGSSAAALAATAEPRALGDVVRWARVDLAAVRGEADRWARAEGPAAPERMRPFSDRVLGLLGWMPATRGITVERRRTAAGWSERLVFAGE
jgi:hypothetical protein